MVDLTKCAGAAPSNALPPAPADEPPRWARAGKAVGEFLQENVVEVVGDIIEGIVNALTSW